MADKNIKNITVIGTGYVGLASAVLLAQHNKVTAFDISEEKVKLINQRISPINDSEIQRYLEEKNLKLSATSDKKEAYSDKADYIVIATPTDYDIEKEYFDTSSVESVISEVSKMSSSSTIIIKSTLPIGFTERIKKQYPELTIIFSPEFLREGKALYDNLYPSRIIIGDFSQKAEIFAGLLIQGAVKKDIPVCYMPPTEAEAVKLFSNNYLALRIAFFNELDTFAEHNRLDTKAIIEGVCFDTRIGNFYNNPSFGYGGYCLPKDTQQLRKNYSGIPNSLISAIVDSNKTRKDYITAMIKKNNPKTVGIYKLAMKSDSDNFRFSAIIEVIENLKRDNTEVIIFEQSVNQEFMFDCPIINDFNQFVKLSDVIVANRMSDELADIKHKVYTRDVFSRD